MINFDMFVETRIQAISIVETAQEYDVLILILDHEMNNWVLTARSVTRFHVNYMCLHNIIDRVCLLDETNTTNEDLRKTIFFLLRGEDAENQEELAWEFVDKVIQEIRLSQCLLLEIEPVSGAHILLTAKDILLQKNLSECLINV
jgi:hypothetical protein